MPKATYDDTTETADRATPIGPAALARTLPELWRQREALEIEILRLSAGREASTARHGLDAVHEQFEAVLRLVLETPATSLEDAAAQLLATYDWTVDHEDRMVKSVARGAISAFWVVAKAAGINPDDFAIKQLAPYAAWPAEVV
jgi:hypothetical protein